MNSEPVQTLLRAVATLWPELPDLLEEKWPQFEAQLLAYLAKIEQEPGRAAIYRALILHLFGDFRPAHERLLRLLNPAEADRLSVTRGIDPRQLPHLLQQIADTATVTRYTDIACPRRVWVETPRITVVVRLTVQEPEYSAAVEKLALQEGVPVRVHITAPAFKALGGYERELPVPPGKNSETSFDLKPLLVGHTRISFDFSQAGNPVGTASVTLEITEQEVSAAAERRKSQLLRFEPGAMPPDLMLYVAYERIGGQPHFIFTLYQGSDEHGTTFAPVPIRGEPQYYAESLYEMLVHWTRQAGAEDFYLSPAEVKAELTQIGQNLWDELIPGDLQTLYLEKRQEWQGKHLLLISDDPYIPWELIWPYSFQQEEQNDPAPWGITLRLTRWLRRDAQGRGYGGPPAVLRIGKLACIAPADIDLPFVAQERAFLAGLTQQYKLVDRSPQSYSHVQILQLLSSGDYHWLHIATHGELEVGPFGQSARIQLEGRESLTPSKIVGPQIKGHIWRERPAFVFNTCHGGRQSWALARLEGWADRLVGAGAGLFIAPLWTVNDERSFQFTQKFYATLLEGQTVADAVHAGRQAAYHDGDPTWLAYSVYAHPNARIQLN